MNRLLRFSVLLSVLAAALLSLFLAVALLFLRGDTFNPWSWQRQAIWLSKRVAAESAALALKIWDPYAGRQVVAASGPCLCPAGLPGAAPIRSADSLRAFLNRTLPGDSVLEAGFDNGALPQGRFGFSYQPPAEPLLDSLRTLYGLDSLARSGEAPDCAVPWRVNRWIYRVFHGPHSVSQVIPEVDFNFNALDILSRTLNGEKFWCSEYSTTLVQALAAIGYTGRYVMLNSDTGGHVTVEAWCDSQGKWVMLDPFFGLRVWLDGQALNVLEIHRLLRDTAARQRAVIERVDGGQMDDREREFYFSLYRDFAVRMRNDWFTNRFPHWHPLSNSVMNAVEWTDQLSRDNLAFRQSTESVEDLYWPLDQVRLSLYPLDATRLLVTLETFCPGFSHFAVGVDSLPPVRCEAGSFVWKLHERENLIRVQAVNERGVAGQPSRVRLLRSSGAPAEGKAPADSLPLRATGLPVNL
ncbi:hypothetical protein LLH00_15195 [bacterium]|nr:hypothetical protein [bacterium]